MEAIPMKCHEICEVYANEDGSTECALPDDGVARCTNCAVPLDLPWHHEPDSVGECELKPKEMSCANV